MKKLLFAMAIATMTLACSCSDNNKHHKHGRHHDKIEACVERCTDADSLHIYADRAKAHVQHLIDRGHEREAMKFLDGIIPKFERKSAAVGYDMRKFREKVQAKANIHGKINSLEEHVDQTIDSIDSKTDRAIEKAKHAL